MANHPREKIEPIPRHYRTSTKPAPGGGYETALFQVFHEDLQVVGEWLHPEETPLPKALQEIHNIKTAKDATKTGPNSRM
jgi:hypothetical protein